MRNLRNPLAIRRSGSAWSETRSGRFLGRAAVAAGLTSAEILTIKARLVQDSRRRPSPWRCIPGIAILLAGLAVSTWLAGRLP